MASSSSLIPIPPLQKVCVVCRRRAKGYLEYWIYIVDLNSAASDNFTRRDPTFRVRDGCFSNPCFCVLGSTLYVFQGYEYDYDAEKFITRGKTVYTYPLPSSSDTANLRLTRSMMFVAKTSLKDVKWEPTAIPTPDGKQILVVSTGFKKLRADSIWSFELYDPLRQTSTVIRASPLERQRVRSVKFIGPRTVLLLTLEAPYNRGCFTLHLDEDHPNNWVNEWEWNRNMEEIIGIQNSFIMRHGWCFTASGAHDICDDHRLRGWAFKYPGDHHDHSLSCPIINVDITPLGDLDIFCTLRMDCTLRPCVLLDVYKFDFIQHQKEVAEVCSRVRQRLTRDEPPFKRRKRRSLMIDEHTPLPGVKIVKSIRFFDARQLDDDHDDYFTAVSFFSIPPTSAS